MALVVIEVATQQVFGRFNRTDVEEQLAKLQKLLLGLLAAVHEVFQPRDLLGRRRVGLGEGDQVRVPDVRGRDRPRVFVVHGGGALLMHNEERSIRRACKPGTYPPAGRARRIDRCWTEPLVLTGLWGFDPPPPFRAAAILLPPGPARQGPACPF